MDYSRKGGGSSGGGGGERGGGYHMQSLSRRGQIRSSEDADVCSPDWLTRRSSATSPSLSSSSTLPRHQPQQTSFSIARDPRGTASISLSQPYRRQYSTVRTIPRTTDYLNRCAEYIDSHPLVDHSAAVQGRDPVDLSPTATGYRSVTRDFSGQCAGDIMSDRSGLGSSASSSSQTDTQPAHSFPLPSDFYSKKLVRSKSHGRADSHRRTVVTSRSDIPRQSSIELTFVNPTSITRTSSLDSNYPEHGGNYGYHGSSQSQVSDYGTQEVGHYSQDSGISEDFRRSVCSPTIGYAPPDYNEVIDCRSRGNSFSSVADSHRSSSPVSPTGTRPIISRQKSHEEIRESLRKGLLKRVFDKHDKLPKQLHMPSMSGNISGPHSPPATPQYAPYSQHSTHSQFVQSQSGQSPMSAQPHYSSSAEYRFPQSVQIHVSSASPASLAPQHFTTTSSGGQHSVQVKQRPYNERKDSGGATKRLRFFRRILEEPQAPQEGGTPRNLFDNVKVNFASFGTHGNGTEITCFVNFDDFMKKFLEYQNRGNKLQDARSRQYYQPIRVSSYHQASSPMQENSPSPTPSSPVYRPVKPSFLVRQKQTSQGYDDSSRYKEPQKTSELYMQPNQNYSRNFPEQIQPEQPPADKATVQQLSVNPGKESRSSREKPEPVRRRVRSEYDRSADAESKLSDRLLSKVTHRSRTSDPINKRVRDLRQRTACLFDRREMSCFEDQPSDYLSEARRKIEELHKEADKLLAGLSSHKQEYNAYEFSEFTSPRSSGVPEMKMKAEKLFSDLFRDHNAEVYPELIKQARPLSQCLGIDEDFLKSFSDSIISDESQPQTQSSKQSQTHISSFSDRDDGDSSAPWCRCRCCTCGGMQRVNSNNHSDCQYTCHHQCRQNVTLDCNRSSTDGAGKTTAAAAKDQQEEEEEPLFSQDTETSLSQLDDGDSGYHTQGSTLLTSTPAEYTLSCEDLHRRIQDFNKHENQGLHLQMREGAEFEGFVRVNMNLMRPINMSIGQRPPSIYEMLTSGGTAERENTKTTSFYLPRDTIKALHISSKTIAQEVITALLNKYQITDNPRKFALYEQTCGSDKKLMMRKIMDHEHPLVICLNWSEEDLERKRFVLQENDTGEIVWEAFSVPELHNFLRILDREESEYVEQVKSKYYLLRFHMEHRMKELKREETERRAAIAASASSNREPVFV